MAFDKKFEDLFYFEEEDENVSEKNEKDERTTFIKNQSYRYDYLILNYGILIDIIYRSIRFKEASWDLFGLIFLSGLVTSAYQYRYKILSKNWVKSILLLMLIAAVSAAIIMLII